MAKSKTKNQKKVAKPSKKQAVAKSKPAKKTAEKKDVKKIIPTSVKKPKKTIKEKPVEVKKSKGRPAKDKVEKTKKTVTPKEEVSAPIDVAEVKSEAINVEDVIGTKKKVTPPFTNSPVTQNTQVKTEAVKEEPKKVEPVVTQPQVQPQQQVKTQPQNTSGGILPVEDDEDDKKVNEMTNTNNNSNSNVQKVYTFNKGIEFMEGHLKVGIDGTNISRRNDTIFDIYGKSEHGAEFRTEFECIDKEEGDFLVTQLNDCEKNSAPFMKGTPTETATTTQQPPQQQTENKTPDLTKSYALDAQGNIDMTKLSAQEIMSIQNGNMPPAAKKDLTGVPLTSVNIDEMINNLPPKPENQNIMSGNTIAPTSNAADISNILNNQNTAQIKAYAQSISDHINTSFQANVWGGMPQNDARAFLANCDKQYLYELLNDGTGFFLKVKKDNVEVRMPENLNEYLKVKQ